MRQHLLPKFYLMGFIDRLHAVPNHVWCYSKAEPAWKRRGIKVAATDENYYSFVDVRGQVNHSMEATQGEVVERLAAPILKDRILQRVTITKEEKGLFAIFVANMLMRAPGHHETGLAIGDLLLQQTFAIMHRDGIDNETTTPELMNRLVAEYEAEMHRVRFTSEEPNFRQFGPAELPPIELTQSARIGLSLLQMTGITQEIARMSWQFLEAPADSLITSDSPGFVVDPSSTGSSRGGLCNPETELTLPLAHNLALLARWGGEDLKWTSIAPESIEQLNIRTLSSAKRFVIASTEGAGEIAELVNRWSTDAL